MTGWLQRGGSLLLALCCVLLAGAMLLEAGLWRRNEILSAPYSRFQQEGSAYRAVPAFAGRWSWLLKVHPSDERNDQRSTLGLFEGGKRLGPANALHHQIARTGQGAFSHWHRDIIFSASDNSDPNQNGRLYTITYELVFRSWALIVVGCAGVVALVWSGLAGLVMRGVLRPAGRRPAEVAREIVGALLESSWLSDRTFYTLLATIIAGGLIHRLAWTGLLQLAYLTPDSDSYLTATLVDPWLPLSGIRTIGYPWILSLALLVFNSLTGILFAHHVIWLASTLLVVHVFISCLRLRLATLAMALYLAICQKNLAFEFQVMVEHTSRALFLAGAAIVIVLVTRGSTTGRALLAGLCVLAGILVKPTAIVLVPAFVIVYAYLWFGCEPLRRKALVRQGLVLCAIPVAGVIIYQSVFLQRFGAFRMTSFEGYNLYSQIGHMTELDGPAHPELKKKLRPVLEKFTRDYASRGRLEPNWFVYGSVDADLSRDFGTTSPRSLIGDYIREQGQAETSDKVDRIFLDLAIESIRLNPLRYARYAATQFYIMMFRGYGFKYGGANYLNPDDIERPYLQSMRLWQAIAQKFGERFRITCADHAGTSQPTWPMRVLLSNRTVLCGDVPPTDSMIARAAFASSSAIAFVTLFARPVYDKLFLLPLWLALLLAALAATQRPEDRLTAGAVSAVVIFVTSAGYCLLVALINTAEVPRYFAHIQDLPLITSLIGLSVLAVETARRLGVASMDKHASGC